MHRAYITHRPSVHPMPEICVHHKISYPISTYRVDIERRVACSVHPPSHCSVPSVSACLAEAVPLSHIRQQQAGTPQRRDPDLHQQLACATLKAYPDRFSALFIGQLPKEADPKTILVVLQYVLERAASATALVYCWDRFKASCGTLWVPQESADAIIEALDCKVQIDVKGGLVNLYSSRWQPAAHNLRRITCEKKVNVNV
jgi:hypothetical protein